MAETRQVIGRMTLEIEKSKLDENWVRLSNDIDKIRQQLESSQKELTKLETERVEVVSKQTSLQCQLNKAIIINSAYLDEQRRLQEQEQHIIQMLSKISF